MASFTVALVLALVAGAFAVDVTPHIGGVSSRYFVKAQPWGLGYGYGGLGLGGVYGGLGLGGGYGGLGVPGVYGLGAGNLGVIGGRGLSYGLGGARGLGYGLVGARGLGFGMGLGGADGVRYNGNEDARLGFL